MTDKNVKKEVAEMATSDDFNAEILKQFGEDGILALQCIREQIEMNKRIKLLKDHPYKPTYNNKNGRWYTRFNEDGKIIQRSRKTKDEIEDLIVEYYTVGFEEKPPEIFTFTKAHDRWMDVQKEYGKTNNSIRRYETDWNRFFADNQFKNMDMTKITSRDIEVFMINAIKKFGLKRRGSDGLYACISGVFYNAVMDRKMEASQNPCIYVDKKKFVKFYDTDEKTVEQRTISPEDLARLINQIKLDINRKESYIYPYGVWLSILTGMRVGEIAGLRWKHIYDNYIRVCESEKYDVVERKYFQHKTKTGKIRNVPITEQIRIFLDHMRDLQTKYGVTEDFVLSFGDGKLRCKNLTAYMNHKCDQLKFDGHKSIYAIRRTFNSFLRYNGASATEAGDLIGNTARVNDAHYTYDIQEFDIKKSYMTKAEMRMISTPLA